MSSMKVLTVDELSHTISIGLKLELEIDGKKIPVTCEVTQSIQGEPETTNYAIGCVRPKRCTPLVLRYRDQIIRAVEMG